MMQPYRPGRIPVVFVHGTASSPARWAEMTNELMNDPVLGREFARAADASGAGPREPKYAAPEGMMMKALVEFLKTTLIGGLLIVVPTYLTVLLLGKALKGMVALLGPIVALLPERLHHFSQILAIVLVGLVCFMWPHGTHRS